VSDESLKNWADWFADPPEPDPDVEHFKWGWNEADGEAVWPVGGPGDGWPGHGEQLRAVWGRERRASDLLGGAEHLPARGADPAVVTLYAHYGAQVPVDVVDWFEAAFPDAQIRLVGVE
jgi:hypothetical protein